MNDAVNPEMVFCRACGKQMHISATACPACGALPATGETDRRILPALVLCIFLGWAGAHRYYVGKVGTGILQLLTGGGFGLWWLIDFIMIVVGSFTDRDGRRITKWT